MIKVLLSILFVAASTFAQPSISAKLGGNLPFAGFHASDDYFLHDYWPVGFNAGVNLQVQLSDWIVSSPGVSYAIFPFKGFTQATLSGDQVALSSSGEGIQQVRLDFHLRLADPSDANLLKPFLELGVGSVFERTGAVTVNWRSRNSSEFSSVTGPEMRQYFDFAFGLGAIVGLSSHVSLEPRVMYRTNARDRVYGLINLDAIYSFRL